MGHTLEVDGEPLSDDEIRNEEIAGSEYRLASFTIDEPGEHRIRWG